MKRLYASYKVAICCLCLLDGMRLRRSKTVAIWYCGIPELLAGSISAMIIIVPDVWIRKVPNGSPN